MSDENDAAPGEPSEAPTTPGPSAEGAGGAESPTQPSPAQPQPAPTPPAADEPITAAPVDEPVTVADPPAEAPTEVAPPAATPPSGAPAGAAAVVPAATAEAGAKGRGVFIPAWVAVVVGVLLIAGLGFAIGWIAAPNDDSTASPAVATSPSPSQNGNSNGNSSNGNGNGNGQSVPSAPGNGSSDDSSGDSSGDSTTPPLLRGAYLGVSVESAANNGGATITSVAADSPAAAAGLKEGDVVTAVDGTQVTSALDLVRQIRGHDINDSITVTYSRNGNTADAKVTLESRPASQSVS